ncbi:MAG: polysulfide reductase [Desulfofustis sp.]|jgi:Ni/Fe-hydrogenase subunit HybB-like protein
MKPVSGNLTDTVGQATIVSGSRQGLLDKIFLGLSTRKYLGLVLTNPVNWILGLILAIGIPLLCQRYLFGLQAITHGSQDYPWGILLGFGLFGMVPLSASGFLLSTTVEIFRRDDFLPIERLALLNGLLGYFFAVVFLLVDLGMPWRLTYPMVVSFGPAAVLFLVAWHVATYLSVQVAEMLPAVSEWADWPSLKRFIKKITLGLTIAGIILSTLHQGALGALFCYAPAKIHPLWIAPEFQWLHFFVSSIFAGLCMVIVVSWLVRHTMTWRCDRRFLLTLDNITLGLAKGAATAMITYLVIKLVAIAHDQEWLLLISGWGLYYLLELGLGTVVPLVIFAYGVRHSRVTMVRWGALLAVAGIVWNRLNTVLICYNYRLHQEIPYWKELWVVLTVLGFYFIVYRFILYRIPVLFRWRE